MQEIEELKKNLMKLEELSKRLGFMLREINSLVGEKDGQTTDSTDCVASIHCN